MHAYSCSFPSCMLVVQLFPVGLAHEMPGGGKTAVGYVLPNIADESPEIPEPVVPTDKRSSLSPPPNLSAHVDKVAGL